MKPNKPLQKHTLLQAAQAQRTDQSLQKSVLFANAQPSDNQSDRKKGQQITAPSKNLRFNASYYSLVVKQTFVLLMNICCENRQLLVVANRYGQP